MTLSRKLMPVVGVALGAALLSAGAEAQSLQGKQVKLVVGHQAGGGYDTYARIFARHFGNFVSGKPSVLVQNMPGGGGVNAANHLFNVAPKDGTALGMFASSAALGPLFNNKKAQFKTSDFSWIGNLDETTSTCAVWHTSGVKTFGDLHKKAIQFGGVSTSSITSQHGLALQYLTKAKIQVVQGYKGSPEINLAMQRGEVQGSCGLAISTLKARYWDDVTAGRLIPIVQLAFDKHPDLPGVAHIYDLLKTDEDKQVAELVYGSNVIGRAVAAPPGVPAALLKDMRAGFMTMVKHEGFLADAKRTKIDITPTSGERLDTIFQKFSKYPQNVIVRAREAVKPKK